MSPDDADTNASQQVTEMPTLDAEAKQKRSFKERFGKGMDKGGDSLGKVPGIKRIPKSLRVIAVLLIVVLIVLAGVAIAMSLGGDEDTGPKPPKTLNVDTLDDWSWSSGPIDGEMTENTDSTMDLETLTGFPTNATIFIDSITMTLEWTDEPDQRWMGRVRVNNPDSFAVEINTSLNLSSESAMTPNSEADKEGSVTTTLAVSGDVGYIMFGNATGLKLPEDVVTSIINLVIYMGEAGNYYAEGPAAFGLHDYGNIYTLTVTCSGKSLAE